MESATLTRDAAGTREAGDTRPTEAALRAALTTDICTEHVRHTRTCMLCRTLQGPWCALSSRLIMLFSSLRACL